MGVLDKAVPVKDTTDFVKLLIYGKPGVGKTRFAAGAPNPIFLDFERSTETLRHIPEYSNIPVLRPQSMSEVFGAIRELPKSDYETVVIDTISQLQALQLRERMLEAEKGGRDKYLPLFQDYRISTSMLDDIFHTLQEMPINVVVCAHDVDDTEDVNGSTRVTATRVNLTPKLAASVTAMINVVGYYQARPSLKGDLLRRMYLNPHGVLVSKNRLNIQEAYVDNPTWDSLFNRSK